MNNYNYCFHPTYYTQAYFKTQYFSDPPDYLSHQKLLKFVGYRTSNLNGAESRVLGISLNNVLIGNRARGDGNCVRCIKD
jgi:hypothetical protein